MTTKLQDLEKQIEQVEKDCAKYKQAIQDVLDGKAQKEVEQDTLIASGGDTTTIEKDIVLGHIRKAGFERALATTNGILADLQSKANVEKTRVYQLAGQEKKLELKNLIIKIYSDFDEILKVLDTLVVKNAEFLAYCNAGPQPYSDELIIPLSSSSVLLQRYIRELIGKFPKNNLLNR